ncbi:hypothetical protein tb265_05190 [Gemmatimonadetes bacterium T265]|nr:hypothetical protein tb265_05190 [Gemmatimonadetes bacterium T265]
MDRRIVFPLLAAVGVFFACGPLPHFGSGLPAHAARLGRPVAGRAPVHHARRLPGAPDVDGALAVTSATEGANTDVHFAFAVVNASDKRLEVDFADGRTRDFAVYDSAGRELWRASRGRLYTQLVQNTLLAAGDSVVYDAAWRAPSPGRYAVVAELRSTNHPLLRRSDFVVPPARTAAGPADTAAVTVAAAR